MNPLLMTKRIPDIEFLRDLKILLGKCQLISEIPNKHPAIVFDIDGTLLYENTDIPITSVIKFCNYCKEIGIATMIVTARRGCDLNINATKKQLETFGLNCDAFYFRHPEETDIETFKTNVRKHLSENLNYNILMSIGDNLWDMGEWGGVGIHMAANNNVITYQIV